MKLHALLLLPLAIGSTSCGILNTTYRTHDLQSDGSALIDVKQRAIIVGHRGGPNGDVVACAEPSPDAMSAYAAELAGKGNISPEQSFELAGAGRESSSFVGLRTQSIQLLRDQGYRICEGYQAGALSRTQYDILMRRHQKMMVSLLAIEQLTGVVRVPAIGINANSQASTALTTLQIEQQIKASGDKLALLRKQQDERQKEKTALEQKLQAAGDEAQAAERQDLSRLEADIKDRKEQIDTEDQKRQSLERALVEAQGAKVSGSLTVNLLGGESQHRADKHIEIVTDAVAEIVEDLVKNDEDSDVCLVAMTSRPEWWDQTAGYSNDALAIVRRREEAVHSSCERFFQRMQLKALTKMRKDAVADVLKARREIQKLVENADAIRVDRALSSKERGKALAENYNEEMAARAHLLLVQNEEDAFRRLVIRAADTFEVIPSPLGKVEAPEANPSGSSGGKPGLPAVGGVQEPPGS